jgi:uncharacterized OB-fold protein
MITTPVKLWRRQKQTASLIGQKGEIMEWTIIRIPPKSFVQEAPYPVVIVKFDNGKKMMGQFVDWTETDLVKGKKVVAVLRKLFPENPESIIAYIIKFKPI